MDCWSEVMMSTGGAKPGASPEVGGNMTIPSALTLESCKYSLLLKLLKFFPVLNSRARSILRNQSRVAKRGI